MTTREALANDLGRECEICGAVRAFKSIRLGSAKPQAGRVFSLYLFIWPFMDGGRIDIAEKLLWSKISQARGRRAGRSVGGREGRGWGTERVCRCCCRRDAGRRGVASPEGAKRIVEGKAREEIGWKGWTSSREDGLGRHGKSDDGSGVKTNPASSDGVFESGITEGGWSERRPG